MNKSLQVKLILILGALAILYSVKSLLSPTQSSDFSDKGTWYRCQSCGQSMQISLDEVTAFYQANPDRNGTPMACPECKIGLVSPGQKCPENGCFFGSAASLQDGRPGCPQCGSALP